MDRQQANEKATLSVHQAAQLIASATLPLAEAELLLAHAIDRGEVPASITRWASEQWDGARLEGNVDRTRTAIARDDFDAWRKAAGLSG